MPICLQREFFGNDVNDNLVFGNDVIDKLSEKYTLPYWPSLDSLTFPIKLCRVLALLTSRMQTAEDFVAG